MSRYRPKRIIGSRLQKGKPIVNVLSMEKKVTVVMGLIEGNLIRSVERMTGVHRDTVMRLLLRTGDQCKKLMDVRLRNLNVQHVQVDEIWTYVQKKARRVRKDRTLPNRIA